MKLKTKLLIIISLFGLQGILHLIDGVMALRADLGFGEYSEAFIFAFIYTFIAYMVYAKSNKSTYWLALFFTILIPARHVMFVAIVAFNKKYFLLKILSETEIILDLIVFGIVPLVYLLDREVRNYFLKAKNS